MESLSWGYYLLFIIVFILPIIAVVLGFMASSRIPISNNAATNGTNTNRTAASLIFWGSVIAVIALIFMLPIVYYPLIFIAPLLLVLVAAILISVGVEYIVVSANNDARTLAITAAILLFVTFIFLMFFIIPVYYSRKTVTPMPVVSPLPPLPQLIPLPPEVQNVCEKVCDIDLNKPDVFVYKSNYNFCL